jgi:hypothetical protein
MFAGYGFSFAMSYLLPSSSVALFVLSLKFHVIPSPPAPLNVWGKKGWNK